MSYINFEITHRFTGGAATASPKVETYSAGFSREGGKLEFVTRTNTPRGGFGPVTSTIDATPEVTAAAAGVLEALRGASWIQSIGIDHGDGLQPNHVEWTYRSGESDSGLTGSLPQPVQSVLDAAVLLEDAARTTG